MGREQRGVGELDQEREIRQTGRERKEKGRWKREMTAEARKTKENTREAAKPSGNLL